MKNILGQYLKNLTETFQRGDAREESYYKHLDVLIKQYAEIKNIKKIDVTIVPKKTEAGNPDFRIWDGRNHITGYIEAKDPSITNLDYIETSEQLQRYCETFPNVILTNFYEFRLYRNGQRIAQTMIARPVVAQKLQITPPLENVEKFAELLDLFFSFSLPRAQTAQALAVELAKRTRFLRDQVIAVELSENGTKGHRQIVGFYEAFKKYLIPTLSEQQFADLYAQTVTYGLFAARTRADGEFNRRLAFDYIPHTIGILRDIFRFISLKEPPKSLRIIVEDIAEILHVADIEKIFREYIRTGKGGDPIIHFYETFLSTYDPEVREKRGVYYTPESVVGYIVRAIHSILKSHFGLVDGLASEKVKLLDPAGGTLTFPAEAIRLAANEFKEKYGEGGLRLWIKKHILANFYAFELMMAPYTVGHLKMGFIFDELGYKLADDERFKLFLTNTLEMEEIEQIALPGLSSLSEESHAAGKIKKEEDILVILGNPPYSGHSANVNEWTEKLLKNDLIENVSIQSYYKVDEQPLGERNPKWLQDDYVKFFRFAQWKVQKAGYGIVGMITNHSYLDNPTFRGMRQSLMKTFDEIYILDLHGNSLKKETTPEGGKDENVFDIRQGVAIILLVKNRKRRKTKVFHADLYGLKREKNDWLKKTKFHKKIYNQIKPQSPEYFFTKRDIEEIEYYLNWPKITEIFPLYGGGMTTARDDFVIDFTESSISNRIRLFRNSKLNDSQLHDFFQINKKNGWEIRKAWHVLQCLSDSELEKYILPLSYRPFDDRYIFWHDSVVWRTVKRIMGQMQKENIGLIAGRQGQVVGLEHPWNLTFISQNMIDFNLFYRGGAVLFPLYLYSDEDDKKNKNPGSTIMMVFEPKTPYGRKHNISPRIYDKLKITFDKRPSPEDILYYIYAIFYSTIYRATYAEFLKIDFPRVPFTTDYNLFKTMGKFGKKLADLHLLEEAAANPPIAKYPVVGENDRIEKIEYKENEKRVYINKDKYFEGIAPEVWNYHIGGYQVLHKYLKDRKGRKMDNSQHYCRMVTALNKTIEIQKKIDEIYQQIEKKTIEF